MLNTTEKKYSVKKWIAFEIRKHNLPITSEEVFSTYVVRYSIYWDIVEAFRRCGHDIESE